MLPVGDAQGGLLCQKTSRLTLIFSIPALHLLVYPLLHLSFEDPGPGRLVEVGSFEYVGRIDIIVFTATHDLLAIDKKLIHRYLVSISMQGRPHG